MRCESLWVSTEFKLEWKYEIENLSSVKLMSKNQSWVVMNGIIDNLCGNDKCECNDYVKQWGKF